MLYSFSSPRSSLTRCANSSLVHSTLRQAPLTTGLPGMAASNRMQGNDVLAAAVRQFQAELKPTENARLLAHSSKPDATSILTFTAEVDSINAHRRSRCVSSRLFGVLQSVQGFSNIADTFVSAHPDIAALVWGCVKFTILVCRFSIKRSSELRIYRLSIMLHPSLTSFQLASSD